MNIIKEKVSLALGTKLAKQISKEDFLDQLKEAWAPELKGKNVEDILSKSKKRIEKSGRKKLFDTVGITDDDLREVIKEIINEKLDPIKVEDTPERNDLCPCGSGRKYKRCCGKNV